MKLLALLALVGFAAAVPELKWQSGKEYTYDYRGRLITGMPEMARQYSGIGMKAKVVVKVKQPDMLVLVVREPEYVRVNDVLEADPQKPIDNENWRNLLLPEMQTVPETQKRILQLPVDFKLDPSNGEVVEIVVSQEDKEWSINFKKALITLFQTKMETKNFEIEENSVGTSMYGYPPYWKVKEQSLDGECECTYQVNEVPEYVVLENPMDVFPKKEECNDKFYEIVRVRDLNSCTKRASFNFYKPGVYNCEVGDRGGNCGMMWSRTSTTKWYTCGPRTDMKVQSIVNDGQMTQSFMGYKTEKMVTGTKQILTLREVRPTSEFPVPPQPITLRTLMYEYTKKTVSVEPSEGESTDVFGRSVEERIRIQSEGRIPKSLLNSQLVGKTLPRNSIQASGKMVNSAEIVQKCLQQIEEISKILKNFEDISIPTNEVNMKVLSTARGISMLTKEEIHGMINKLGSTMEESAKSIFVDTVIMAGTKDAYAALFEMSKEGKLNRQQLYSIFLWMPHYLLTPTRSTLHLVKQFVMTPEVQQHKELRHIAITSFSQLLQWSCLKENRKSSYPTNVYGEFCHPDSEIVQSQWIPYLAKKISETGSHSEKNIYIIAMGLLTHKNVISHLLPILDKTSRDVSELNRLIAMYSLNNVASADPNLVIPVFLSIFTNPSESTELRITAFNSLVRLNPSTAVFQMIATVTRTEPKMDMELLKTINLGLYTIGYNTEYQPTDEYYSSLASKARAAYSIIKKSPGILPTSASVYGKSTLFKLNLGIESFVNWISSESSFLPKHIYTEIAQVLGQYHMYSFKMGLRMKGVQDLFEKVSKKMMQEQGGSLEEQIKSTLSGKWTEIIEKLQLKVREDKTVDTGFFLSVFESAPIFLNIDSLTENISEKVLRHLKNPSHLEEGTYENLYFQHVVDVSPIETVVPSDMGFPINTEFHAPVTVFINGKLMTKVERSMPSIEFDGRVIYSSQPVGWVGTVCPFTNELVFTGAKQNTGIQLPTKFHLKLDMPKGEVKLSLKTLDSHSEKVNIAFFHVLPFTVHKKVDDLRPMTQELETLKPIKSNTEEKKYGKTFGDYLGLKLSTVLKTESRFTDLKYLSDMLSMYGSGLLNYVNFGWTLPAMDIERQPSLRKQELDIHLRPSESTTKEIEMVLKFGCATKQVGEPMRYHGLEVLSESEPISYQQYQKSETPLMHGIPALRKVLPYKVVSFPLGESSIHQERQQKLKHVMEPLELESGTGMTVMFDLLLKGSRTTGYHYVLSTVMGASSKQGREEGELKEKWALHLENPTSVHAKHLCVKGDLTIPTLPVWNINDLESSVMHIKLANTISYGMSSCDESKIVTVGQGKVTSEQKKFSRESPERKKCIQMIEERVPGAKLSPICKKALSQASTIDRLVIKTEFNNVSKYVIDLERKLTTYVKMYLWPYTKPFTSLSLPTEEIEEEQTRIGKLGRSDYQGLKESFETVTQVIFKPQTPSFDLIIEKPGEHLRFVDVSIRKPFSLFYPISVTENNLNLLTQRITGQTAPPTCKVDGRKTISTFDNKTIPFRPGSCPYLLAGDCSPSHSFGIAIKPLSSSEESVHELEVFLGKEILKLVPTAQKAYSEIKVKVNGQELPIPKGVYIPIKGEQGERKTVAVIFRSQDNVVTLKAPQYYLPELKFNGKQVEVLPSLVMKNKMCGLCGDFNGQVKADIPGPRKCIYSKSELEVASYRIPSRSCAPLPERIQEELKKETEQCARYKVQPTEVTKSFKVAAGKCIVSKHVAIQRPGQVCISKVPVTQCGPSCKVDSQKKVKRSVPFTCLKDGRLAEHYLKKIKEGKPLPELRGTPTLFSSILAQPRHCVHAIMPLSGRYL